MLEMMSDSPTIMEKAKPCYFNRWILCAHSQRYTMIQSKTISRSSLRVICNVFMVSDAAYETVVGKLSSSGQ